MSRTAPATPEEITAVFDQLMAHPDAGGQVPTGLAVDDETARAIERVWAAGSDPSPALVEAARHELALQLDGTHAREAGDRQNAVIAQVLAHASQA